jgi:hypothetical protein
MKKIEVEISLRDARNGYWRIEDNRFLSENGEWTASNIWESKEFEGTELEEMEEMEEMQSLIEGVLSGLEYEIAIVEF